jgi:N-acyl-D-amino-acid deacylase
MGKILLKGGKVIDGTGSASFDGSVLIDGDRIEAVLKGKEVSPDADTVIDATGYAIAPGFIDMHSHMDWSLPLDEHPQFLKCFLEQGVTTLVGGNCGFSPAPVTSETFGLLEKEFMLPIDKPLDYNWRSMNEFLETTQQRKPVVNLAQLVGHATVRIAGSSTRRGPMKQDELRSCLRKLEQSLDEGACGVSFGLGYDPGIYSPLAEIEEFAEIAAKAKKPMTVHLKTYVRLSAAYPITYYKPHNLRALKEMLNVAQRTDIALQISHFMVAFRITWPMAEVSLQTIEKARNEGVDVMFDALPYTDLNGSIATLLPMWFLMKLPQGYRSPLMLTGAKIVNAIGFRRVGYSYSKQCLLMDAGMQGWEDMSGLTIDEIARERSMSPSDAKM